MAKKMRIKVDGQDLEVQEVDFDEAVEKWNVYKLLDGGQVKTKTTVSKIFRVLDAQGKPDYTAEGDPHIIVRHRTEVVASE